MLLHWCGSSEVKSGYTFRKNVGGVVGYVNESTVSNCYSTRAVTGVDFNSWGTIDKSSSVGGVAGNITNCYATGAVSGQDNVAA